MENLTPAQSGYIITIKKIPASTLNDLIMTETFLLSYNKFFTITNKEDVTFKPEESDDDMGYALFDQT